MTAISALLAAPFAALADEGGLIKPPVELIPASTLGLPRGKLVSDSEEAPFFRLVRKAKPHESFQVKIRGKFVGR